MEKQLILIDLKENLNPLDYPFLLKLNPSDIELMKKIDSLLIKHFSRPWVYVGAENPYPPKKELHDDIDKLDLPEQEKEKIKKFVTEIKLPVELGIASVSGDKHGFHNHTFQIPANLQLEQYFIPENKSSSFMLLIDKKEHSLEVKGPSILIIGKINHRRVGGECFVMKTPPGDYKTIV